MENHKVTKRNFPYAKLLVLGLIAVGCFLSFKLHKERKVKEDLVRRKSELVDRLSASLAAGKVVSEKLKETSTALEEQIKQVDAQKKESGALQSKLDTISKSYEKKVSELETLRKDTSKLQENLVKKRNASSTA